MKRLKKIEKQDDPYLHANLKYFQTTFIYVNVDAQWVFAVRDHHRLCIT